MKPVLKIFFVFPFIAREMQLNFQVLFLSCSIPGNSQKYLQSCSSQQRGKGEEAQGKGREEMHVHTRTHTSMPVSDEHVVQLSQQLN